MNHRGIYREPGPLGGLPLPRTHLRLTANALRALAAVSVVAPLVLIVCEAHSERGAWQRFREGGFAMWLVLISLIGAAVSLTVLGTAVSRGRRVSPAVLFVLAVAPLGVALAGAAWSMREVRDALASGAVEPSIAGRLLNQGVAEIMALDVFGGFATSVLAVGACVACASALLTLDPAKITPPVKAAPHAKVCAVLVTGWLLASMVVARARFDFAGGLALAPPLLVALVGSVAVLGARRSALLRGWHDVDEGGAVAGSFVVSGLAGLVAVLAYERALAASLISDALSMDATVSYEAASETTEKVRLVLAQTRLTTVSVLAHGLFGLLVFAIAIVPAVLRSARGFGRTFRRGPLAALVCALGLAVAWGAIVRTRLASGASLVEQERRMPSDIALPVITDLGTALGSMSPRATAIVPKDGIGQRAAASSCTSDRDVRVVADRAATLDRVRAHLPDAKECTLRIAFAARSMEPSAFESLLEERRDELALLRARIMFLVARVADGSTFGAGRQILHVDSILDDAIAIDGARCAFPFRDDLGPPSAVPIERIHYHFRTTDTVDHAIAVIASVEGRYRWRISTTNLERIVDLGSP